jgi:hypothetical protein
LSDFFNFDALFKNQRFPIRSLLSVNLGKYPTGTNSKRQTKFFKNRASSIENLKLPIFPKTLLFFLLFSKSTACFS